MKKGVSTPKPLRTEFAEAFDCDDHGGGCCGRVHLFNFDGALGYYGRFGTPLTFAEKKNGIRLAIDEAWGIPRLSGRGMCVEVVLVEDQMEAWSRALTGVGFKRVFDFVNENSGNRCYVFLLDTSKVKS